MGKWVSIKKKKPSIKDGVGFHRRLLVRWADKHGGNVDTICVQKVLDNPDWISHWRVIPRPPKGEC